MSTTLCSVCETIGLGSGGDGFYYCLTCSTQSQDLVEQRIEIVGVLVLAIPKEKGFQSMLKGLCSGTVFKNKNSIIRPASQDFFNQQYQFFIFIFIFVGFIVVVTQEVEIEQGVLKYRIFIKNARIKCNEDRQKYIQIKKYNG